jgi:hypothetical protein
MIKALLQDVSVIYFPAGPDANLFDEFTLNSSPCLDFFIFEKILLSELCDAACWEKFGHMSLSILIFYHVVLLPSFHECWKYIKRHVHFVEQGLLFSIDKVGLFILDIFLNDVSPNYSVAFVIKLYLIFIFFE